MRLRGSLVWRVCLVLALLAFDGGLLFRSFRPAPPPAPPPAWLQEEARAAWTDLLGRTGRPPSRMPPIRTYPDKDAFEAALSRAGGNVPASEAAGFWDGTAVHVGLADGEGVARLVVRHELAHALIEPGDPPRWFGEGFAQWVMRGAPGGADRLERLAAQYADGSDALALLDRGGAVLDEAEAISAYRAAEAVVRAMVARWGADRLWALVSDLARGVPFETALRERYGLGRAAPAGVF